MTVFQCTYSCPCDFLEGLVLALVLGGAVVPSKGNLSRCVVRGGSNIGNGITRRLCGGKNRGLGGKEEGGED